MNILFISEDLVAGNLALTLQKEGAKVKLCILDKGRKNNFDGLITKVSNWKKELSWVGRNGLIIFDGVGLGRDVDSLRTRGYTTMGSSALGNRLENNRDFGAKTFHKYGLRTSPLHDFDSITSALHFVKTHKGMWVVKQNSAGTNLKGLNYVGVREDASDVVDVLNQYLPQYRKAKITLHRKVEGVEIGIGRFFNGTDWVGPSEINIEHKKFFPGDLGPTTSEMGTVAWYDDNPDNKLFKEILNPLAPYLRTIDFRGDFEVNCIVNETGAYPLEATPRFGSPIIHLQTEIHETPWSEFLLAIAKGRRYGLRWKQGFGIAIVVTVPTSLPFPFTKAERYLSPKNTTIFLDKLSADDMSHVHFEDVSFDKRRNRYFISDDRGYVLYVTAVGSTPKAAQDKVYALIKKIHIPKMFYRNDIGTKFIDVEQALLAKWGYLEHEARQ